MNELVTCRFSQASVQLMENLESKNGLGSTWMFQCQNESCPSHETNLAFPTTEKSRAFAINHALVLSFRAIGGGHAAASKVFSWPAAYHLSNAYCCCKMIRCYNPIAGKMPQKYIFSFFLGTKISES